MQKCLAYGIFHCQCDNERHDTFLMLVCESVISLVPESKVQNKKDANPREQGLTHTLWEGQWPFCLQWWSLLQLLMPWLLQTWSDTPPDCRSIPKQMRAETAGLQLHHCWCFVWPYSSWQIRNTAWLQSFKLMNSSISGIQAIFLEFQVKWLQLLMWVIKDDPCTTIAPNSWSLHTPWSAMKSWYASTSKKI